MKRIIGIPMLAVLLALTVAAVVYGQARIIVRERVTITVNRAEVQTDVPPINMRGHVLVPVRSVFEAFDADIDWFPREDRVFIRKDCTVIWLQIRDAHAKVNDNIIPLATPVVLYRGRTMVPLRFIAESLGANVNWDPSTQTITITTTEARTAAPSAAPAPPPAEPPSDTSEETPDSGYDEPAAPDEY